MNAWSKETIALTREMFESRNGGMLKSLDKQFGIGAKLEDGTCAILVINKTNNQNSLNFSNVEALIDAGWVVD
jgi:hypothetical protein